MDGATTRPQHAGTQHRPRRAMVALAAVVLALSIVTGALAANPKPGKQYSGFTSERPVNHYHAPVTFKVSANGSLLLKFQYATLGCFGGGAFGGDVFKVSSSVEKVGTVRVGTTGSFAATGARSTFVVRGQKTVTTTRVIGRFRTSRLATGKISYTQTFTDPQTEGSACGPISFRFTAKLG